LRNTWHVFEILVSHIMEVTKSTYELCEMLLGFMSYVFMKILEWKKTYFVIWNLWKILFKNIGVFYIENYLQKYL
jgi:hypothetical protein